MVTKALHPADPLCRSLPAKAAVDEERFNLQNKGVWDLESVMERSKAKEL